MRSALANSAGVTSERVSLRAAMRVWGDTDGEVGSIVSTVDDIIPDQWRNTRDEGLRGEHAARAGWWGRKGRMLNQQPAVNQLHFILHEIKFKYLEVGERSALYNAVFSSANLRYLYLSFFHFMPLYANSVQNIVLSIYLTAKVKYLHNNAYNNNICIIYSIILTGDIFLHKGIHCCYLTTYS